MTMTLAQAHTAAVHSGAWISYGGTARTVLAIVLVAAVAGVVYTGVRIPLPVRLPRPSARVRTAMLLAWVFAIAAFLVCVSIYVQQGVREHSFHGTPANPITPVTDICVAGIFVIILILGRPLGWRVALGSAAIGAMAAPMIFEFPFDLIVMARIYPPIPPDPALYRALFFVPLFLIELTTLSLLTLSPMVRVSRAAFFLFAVMLVIYAVWGLAGFGYPSTPLPFALNVASKIVAFVAALSLFLRRRAPAGPAGPPGTAAAPAAAVRSGDREL